MNCNPFDSSSRCSIETARTIRPGDMVKVLYGAQAGNTVIVIAIMGDSKVFSPFTRYEGVAVNFMTDEGRVGHYCLAPDAIVHAQWIPESEVLNAFAAHPLKTP